jgi:hypothetical protein
VSFLHEALNSGILTTYGMCLTSIDDVVKILDNIEVL